MEEKNEKIFDTKYIYQIPVAMNICLPSGGVNLDRLFGIPKNFNFGLKRKIDDKISYTV